MVGFNSFDDFLNEVTVNGKTLAAEFYKVGTAAEAAGVPHSLWKVGHYPAAGEDGASTPGTAHTSSDGSLIKWANQSPDTKHLVTFSATATTQGMLVLYDRLVSVNFSFNSTGEKTINSTTLPRYAGTDSVGLQAWVEVTTVTSSAAVMNMSSYTDQDGNGTASGGNITFPAAATNVNAFIGPLPLAAGDTGLRSVETITVGTSGGGSAAGNLVIMKPLAYCPLIANRGTNNDHMIMIPSLPRIYDGATLALYYVPSTTTATSFWGSIRAGYG